MWTKMNISGTGTTTNKSTERATERTTGSPASMGFYMRQGWRLALKHWPAAIVLFMYQLLWGFFLYRFVASIVQPLLVRYPDALPDENAVQLFMMEAQFQLMKTDVVQPYLWLLLSLVGARMLVTPFIHAGLFHSLHAVREGGGTRFFAGIKRAWKPVLLVYGLEKLLIAGPAAWLLYEGGRHVLAGGGGGGAGGGASGLETLLQGLPYAIGWLIWAFGVHLAALALQFGAAAGTPLPRALLRTLRHALPFAAATVVMWAIVAACGLAASGISVLWAGFGALLLHQGYYFVRTLLKLWTFGVQFELWSSKQG